MRPCGSRGPGSPSNHSSDFGEPAGWAAPRPLTVCECSSLIHPPTRPPSSLRSQRGRGCCRCSRRGARLGPPTPPGRQEAGCRCVHTSCPAADQQDVTPVDPTRGRDPRRRSAAQRREPLHHRYKDPRAAPDAPPRPARPTRLTEPHGAGQEGARAHAETSPSPGGPRCTLPFPLSGGGDGEPGVQTRGVYTACPHPRHTWLCCYINSCVAWVV